MKAFKIIFLSLLGTLAVVTPSMAQIQVNSSGVRVTQPLFVNNVKSSTGSVIFNVGTASGLELYQSATGGSMSNYYSYLRPVSTNTIYLGETTRYFFKSYITDMYTATNPHVTSDLRRKENIRNIESSIQQILALRPVLYDLKPIENIPADYLKNKAGFIAQEVEPILPVVVHYDKEEDVYALDYGTFIPYIVKAFQEEHAENIALRAQVEDMQKMLDLLWETVLPGNVNTNKSGTSLQTEDKTINQEKTDGCRLYQNTPNPFSETTVIRYTLTTAIDNAYIQITDMQGKSVYKQTLPVGETQGQIEITAGKLSPGMYTYTLIVSGKQADSKKMVVTE